MNREVASQDVERLYYVSSGNPLFPNIDLIGYDRSEAETRARELCGDLCYLTLREGIVTTKSDECWRKR